MLISIGSFVMAVLFGIPNTRNTLLARLIGLMVVGSIVTGLGILAMSWLGDTVDAQNRVEAVEANQKKLVTTIKNDQAATQYREAVVADNHLNKTEISRRVDRRVEESKRRNAMRDSDAQAALQIHGLWGAWCETQASATPIHEGCAK